MNKSAGVAIVLATCLISVLAYDVWSKNQIPPKYATYTAKFYALRQDAAVYVHSENYNTAWASKIGTVVPEGSLLIVGQWALRPDSDSPLIYDLQKSFVAFDTSFLPDYCEIVEATFSGFVYMMPTFPQSTYNIVIQNGASTHVPPLPTEYDRELYGTSVGGSRNPVGTAVSNNYWNITLNSLGLSWVSKNGLTKFVLRCDKEMLGEVPKEGELEFIRFASADWDNRPAEPLSPAPPILYITYRVRTG